MICLLAISFGFIGACLGAAAVNENYDPRQWDWTSGKTWLGLIEGGVAKGFYVFRIQGVLRRLYRHFY